jgi:hypothetical protein
MKKLEEPLYQIGQIIGEHVMHGPYNVRGAMLLSGEAKDQQIVIYASEMSEPGDVDDPAELAVVRSQLAHAGVREVMSYRLQGGYIVVVTPLESWEVVPDELYECDRLTDQALIQRNLLLRALGDLPWHAWAVTQGIDQPRAVSTCVSDVSRKELSEENN